MRMDLNKPHTFIQQSYSQGGEGCKSGETPGHNYALQDGKIFCWSESNIGYELAWWLTDAGDPINDSEHVKNLLRDRPFDKAWLA